jgi:MFS family permease
MLRYLFVVDVSLSVLGASMVIGVGVSALLLAIYLDQFPEYRGMMTSLINLTLAYLAVTLSAGAAGWGIHRRRAWHWLAQAAFAASLVFSWRYSISLLANT